MLPRLPRTPRVGLRYIPFFILAWPSVFQPLSIGEKIKLMDDFMLGCDSSMKVSPNYPALESVHCIKAISENIPVLRSPFLSTYTLTESNAQRILQLLLWNVQCTVHVFSRHDTPISLLSRGGGETVVACQNFLAIVCIPCSSSFVHYTF